MKCVLLCVYVGLSASVGKCARYGRRIALLGTNGVLTFVAQRKNRSRFVYRSMPCSEPCTVGDPLCSYLDYSHLFIAHCDTVTVTRVKDPTVARSRQTPVSSFDAPRFASPGGPLRTCVNQLGRCPSKNGCWLPAAALCPGRWRGCGRPSQGQKTHAIISNRISS